MPADAELSVENVRYLLDQLDSPDRNPIAAALSKVAAKADDDILLMLSEYAGKFVEWLCDNESEDPLVKAYTACILANIAFLAPGQEKVLEAHGVKPLVKLLKAKDADKKITLHSTAAVQNLTYKNTACCQQVLEEGGESTLKKLLKVRPRRRTRVGGKLPLPLPLLPLPRPMPMPRLLPRLRGCCAATLHACNHRRVATAHMHVTIAQACNRAATLHARAHASHSLTRPDAAAASASLRCSTSRRTCSSLRLALWRTCSCTGRQTIAARAPPQGAARAPVR